MRFVQAMPMVCARLALVVGIACSAAFACGPRARPAGAPAGGTTQLSWQALAKQSNPSLGSPPSLKADDGRSSKLRTLTVRASVIPPLASTELDMVFDELPAGQEGALFSIELPEGAALSRFAVYDEGSFHDAVPAKATGDPSLRPFGSVKPLFDKPGGVTQSFSARVLRGRGAPRLRVAYTSLLPLTNAPYAVRLAGLPRLDAFDATVRVQRGAERHTYELRHENFVPDRDFSVSAEAIGAPSDFQALRAGKYAVARIVPRATRGTELTFLVDTSLSAPVPLAQISQFLASVSETLGAEKNPPLITVVGFDQDVRPIVVRAKAPISREQLAPLAALERLGGTDLTYALSALVTQKLPHTHVVMVSDFENTMQPVGNPPSSRDLELVRLDSLVANAAAEKALLAKYDEPFGYRPDYPSIMARLDDDPARVARLLAQPTPEKTSVTVKGASWSWPPSDERMRVQEFTPEIGKPIWVFAEYDALKPLEVDVDGKPKPAVAPVGDETLSALLKSVVGGARLRQLLAYFPYGYTEPGDAAQALSELERLTLEYGLISPLSSFVVRGSASGGDPRPLAGRVVDTANTRLIMSTTMVPPGKPPPRPEKCPELIGHWRSRDDDGCPALSVDFSEPRARILADVRFAAGSGEPMAKLSPHLDQLADLLTLRPELAKVSVRVANRAQADGVVRYLVKRGVSADRFKAERLLEGDVLVRKPTPKCKTVGQQVVLEILEMSLSHINRLATRRPVEPIAQPGPSRLRRIEESLRASLRAREGGQEALDEAVRSSEAWVLEERTNPLAYVALGNVLHARRDDLSAARAYGSLFDLNTPGAGLDLAAALRFERLSQRRGSRFWELAMATFRKRWEASKTSPGTRADVEGSRAYAYAALAASKRTHGGPRPEMSGEMIYEAFETSAIVAQIEAPVFAHVDLHTDRRAHWTAESSLGRGCRFPMQGSVLGAVLSWEDPESELEVDVTSVEAGFTYDSVLVDRTPAATLKWLPLPEDDAAYPIRISVRAERLGKKGYAFGMLRVLNYSGRGRVFIKQEPFAVTLVGERVLVHQEAILQRPQ